jgi:hypothetical protein
MDRPFVPEEFVGRDTELGNVWKVARQETEKRVLLVLGPFGIGKSWLLHKLELDREEAGIEAVMVNFAVPPLGAVEWGYLDIALAVRDQLGRHFDELDAAVAAARKESEGLGIADPFATQLGAGAPAPAAPAVPAAGPITAGGDAAGRDQIEAAVGDIGTGAQVAVGSQISMAQRDVNYYFVQQGPRQGDQQLQQHHQAAITAALRSGLEAAAADGRKVAFVFDSWLKATTPTRDWLCRTVIAWVRDKEIAGTSAVVADDSAIPELQQRHPRVYSSPLDRLTEDEIVEYWVEKRGLDREKASWVVQACLGHPLTLAMIADLHEQTGGL